MNRTTLSFTILALSTSIGCGLDSDHKQSSNSLPNIILILGDDIGYSDIGPYGSEIETPNLNRFGSTGDFVFQTCIICLFVFLPEQPCLLD